MTLSALRGWKTRKEIIPLPKFTLFAALLLFSCLNHEKNHTTDNITSYMTASSQDGATPSWISRSSFLFYPYSSSSLHHPHIFLHVRHHDLDFLKFQSPLSFLPLTFVCFPRTTFNAPSILSPSSTP